MGSQKISTFPAPAGALKNTDIVTGLQDGANVNYTLEQIRAFALAVKTLTKGKIWVGGDGNVAEEKTLAFVTVGPSGVYPTISEAIAAGYRNLHTSESFVDNGDISEDFYLSGGRTAGGIELTGNVTASVITISQANIVLNCSNEYAGEIRGVQSDVTIQCDSSSLGVFLDGSDSTLYLGGVNSSVLLVIGYILTLGLNSDQTIVLADCIVKDFISGGHTADITLSGECSFKNDSASTITDLRIIDEVAKYIRNDGTITNTHFSAACLIVGGYLKASNYTVSGYTRLVGVDLDVVTFPANIELVSCNNGTLTLSGRAKVIGGKHNSIVINADYTKVLGVEATTITLGAVTGCSVSDCVTTNPVVDVLGNNTSGNETP